MYIDPNSGGMLFQVLAALFGGIMVFFYAFSGKIRQAIAKLRRSTRKDNDEEQQ